jgi:hypothetical protein
MLETDWKDRGARAKHLWKNIIGGGNLSNLLIVLEEETSFHGTVQILTHILNGRPRGDMDKFYRELSSVFAKRLQARYQGADPHAVSQTIYRHLADGHPECVKTALSALTALLATHRTSSDGPVPDRAPPATPVRTKPSPSDQGQGIDLWTPGPLTHDILAAFAPSLQPDTARRIADLSHEGISAITNGDFSRQVAVAQTTLELARELQSERLIGEAEYLRGEGLRLLADFERDHAKARELREAALAAYDNSSTSLGNDPRPIRGSARVQEVLGRPDVALSGFERALSLAAFRLSTARPLDTYSLSHELIRSIRHKFYCAAEIQKNSAFGQLPSSFTEQDFETLIVRSERDHKQVLARFRSSSEWWSIEWFMAQVIHAKGWLALSQPTIAARRLLWALEMRFRLMPKNGQVSDVEAGNLMWWFRAAIEAERGFERHQRPAIEAFGAGVMNNLPRHHIHELGGALLNSDVAPWAQT